MEGHDSSEDATCANVVVKYAHIPGLENSDATCSVVANMKDSKAEDHAEKQVHRGHKKAIAFDADHPLCDGERSHPEARLVIENEMCKGLHSMGIGEQVNHEDEYPERKNLPEVQLNMKDEICAICHDRIKVKEASQIQGCEHTYCVTCILRWASYKKEPWCPQCRLPFSFLYVYKALDGTISDYMFEESVCLLLRAFWFKPLIVEDVEEQDDYQDDYDVYEECFYPTNVRLGNRRWGDTGYVRGGRREARPVGVRQVNSTINGGSSSSHGKGKEPAKEVIGRRALRAQKRQQIDQMAAKK